MRGIWKRRGRITYLILEKGKQCACYRYATFCEIWELVNYKKIYFLFEEADVSCRTW